MTVSQVALSWIISQNAAIPIPAALNPLEGEENANAANVVLSPAEISLIGKAAPSLGAIKYYFDHFAIRPISWTKASLTHFFSKNPT
jgi:diketogulonate reductase-like aldo/keto reductase